MLPTAPLILIRFIHGRVLLARGAYGDALAELETALELNPSLPAVYCGPPDTMQKPPGYSHVVEVTGPGRTVYFAGQLGINKSGKMGANARGQMEIAFENGAGQFHET